MAVNPNCYVCIINFNFYIDNIGDSKESKKKVRKLVLYNYVALCF